MPIDLNFERKIFEYIENIKNSIRVQPMYLGSTSSGTGTPPGGIIGWLAQSKVSYDPVEATLATTSGTPSIIDNLNHIRYDIITLSGLITALPSEAGVVIRNNGVVVASGVTVIDFVGDIVVTDNTDHVTITVVASGGGGGHIIQYSGNSMTQRNKLNFEGIGITVIDDAANDRTTVRNDLVVIGAEPVSPFAGQIWIDTGV